MPFLKSIIQCITNMNGHFVHANRSSSHHFTKQFFAFVNYRICERYSVTKTHCNSFFGLSKKCSISPLSALTLVFYALSDELIDFLFNIWVWLNERDGITIWWLFIFVWKLETSSFSDIIILDRCFCVQKRFEDLIEYSGS